MKDIRKAASIALVLMLLINLVLFAARRIHAIQFWLIIIVAAVVAFLILPRIRSEVR